MGRGRKRKGGDNDGRSPCPRSLAKAQWQWAIQQSMPQLNEIGLQYFQFRNDLIPKFGFEDNDQNNANCMPEPIDPCLGFSLMGGSKEFIDEVRNRVLFPIVNSDFVTRHGRYPPKGILLHGPPGTGKTLFAKCLAAELSRLGAGKYTFFMRRGADVLSCLVGCSEKNIKAVFSKAVQCKPSIIFFDEADGLVPNRKALENTVPVYTNVVTSILTEMDKLKRGEVIVIFATNRLEALDPAIKRPGRVDVVLAFLPPNVEERKKILGIYTKDWGPSAPSPTLMNQMSLATNGFTGADLDKLCSEAFFACVRRTQKNCGFNVCPVKGDEQITETDWMEAMTSMRPSQSNIFDSYVQVLEVSSFAEPLIKNAKASIVDLLEGNQTIMDRVTGGPNCFLIWNSNPKSNEILDLLVLPSVFAGLSTQPVLFVLSEEVMLHEFHTFSVNSIVKVAAQAKDCPKNCIIFIPRFDVLAGRMGKECAILRRVLFDTANKSTLVVGTAGCDVQDLPSDVQPLFDGTRRSFKLEKPTDSERKEFYAPLFTENPTSGGGDGSQPGGVSSCQCKLNLSSDGGNSLLDSVVSLTCHDDFWSMLCLHRELTVVAKKPHKCGNTEKEVEMRNVIDAYRRNRLSVSSK